MDKTWDAKGVRRMKFRDGSYKNVEIASFVLDYSGIPMVVVGQDGSTYPWNAIISIGPVKEPKT